MSTTHRLSDLHNCNAVSQGRVQEQDQHSAAVVAQHSAWSSYDGSHGGLHRGTKCESDKGQTRARKRLVFSSSSSSSQLNKQNDTFI